MNEKTIRRAVTVGEYIAEKACTVRAAAAHFGLGKSTVHKDLAERLPAIDPELYEKVRELLDYNLSVRHLRGGEATRKKYMRKRDEKRS